MYLTEEQIKSREDMFMEMVEMLADELYEEKNDSYELTEEDAYIASIMMEHFIENYKDVSLAESVIVAMTGQDPNQELFEEFIEMALDESVGGVIAGAVHGIKNFLSKRRATSATSAAASAKQKAGAVKQKMVSAQKDASKAKGFSGVFKRAKASALEKRHSKAVDKQVAATNKARAERSAHTSGLKARAGLKNKIDTGISNVKKKVTGAIKSGAEKVASTAGRVAGALA